MVLFNSLIDFLRKANTKTRALNIHIPNNSTILTSSSIKSSGRRPVASAFLFLDDTNVAGVKPKIRDRQSVTPVLELM